MRVAIIDYGSGNLRSAEKSFQRAARERDIAADIVVTDDPDFVAKADRIVLPGVGAFADCRAGLFAIDGLVEALRDSVEQRAVPFFGICVGMQLMASRGLEKEVSHGLGWIAGDVVPIKPLDPELKIPQMGWNTLLEQRAHPVCDGIQLGPDGLNAYFVHSYHMVPENPDHIVALTDHGGPVTAIVARDNLIGTQFHPEKSQQLGLSLIGNFLNWWPAKSRAQIDAVAANA
ncbi:imidazole glycerol phosphate synthase subunit HisH [Pararhizobium sp. IMCC21322]|uniref:imidazole glycerol phosphate synthase subunit HisH n=1 Tax=Pararhizobium sp. IMCC21322 TaxID=3067903 RepID=UPI00274180CF|nr:imidazole glycerol phosphate synthase subunit HisH [Pararhizobium sp. IMCC21322]